MPGKNNDKKKDNNDDTTLIKTKVMSRSKATNKSLPKSESNSKQNSKSKSTSKTAQLKRQKQKKINPNLNPDNDYDSILDDNDEGNIDYNSNIHQYNSEGGADDDVDEDRDNDDWEGNDMDEIDDAGDDDEEEEHENDEGEEVDEEIDIGTDVGENEDCMYNVSRKVNGAKKLGAIIDKEDDDDDEDVADYTVNENELNEDLYVKPEERRTANHLFLYEKVRLLGDRTAQLAQGAKPMIKGVEDFDPRTIAQLELESKMIPIMIIRPLPNGKKEKWSIKELRIKKKDIIYGFTSGNVDKSAVQFIKEEHQKGGSIIGYSHLADEVKQKQLIYEQKKLDDKQPLTSIATKKATSTNTTKAIITNSNKKSSKTLEVKKVKKFSKTPMTKT